MGLRYEYTQKIDYADIINRQLDRIAQIRTNVHKYLGKDAFTDPYFLLAREYISAVETLYVILLPELRGESTRYILLAKKCLSILQKIDKILGPLPGSVRENIFKLMEEYYEKGRPPEYFDEIEKKYGEEVCDLIEEYIRAEEKRYKILDYLPEKYKELVSGYEDYPGLFVFYFLDAALEEMLDRLNQAGLLIQGRTVSIGVPHVLSGTDKEGLQV